MKRAYPQYLAAGGEKIPPELLRVLFPVNYWPLIQRYASAHQLDPYMIAALIAQESTFTADVRSAANAYGLMQILPSTGRQYARKVGITTRFSLSLLTTAEPNIKMGTAYFADLVQQVLKVCMAAGLVKLGHVAIDGTKIGEFKGLRWRSSDKLQVNTFWLLYYITEQSARHNNDTNPDRKSALTRLDQRLREALVPLRRGGRRDA